MRLRQLAIVFVVCGVLSSCATRTYREDSKPPETNLLTTYEAQVTLGSCAFKPQPEAAIFAAIASALLSSAVSQGVDYVGKALTEAAKETNDRVTATRNIEVSAQQFGPCLQVVRGWFYRGFTNPQESIATFETAVKTWAASDNEGTLDPSKLTLLWQRRIWPAMQPDFVFEAQVVPSRLSGKPDESLLTLIPVYARMDQPVSTARFRSSKSREVAVFFAFHQATAEPSAPNAAGGLVLGRLDAGKSIQFPPVDVDTTNTPNRAPGESKWFSLAIGKDKRPMTVTALVTEHQDADAFLQFVADVFNGAKAPITSALQAEIVPAARAQAEETETAKAEAARGAYEDSMAKALAAATTCSATEPKDAVEVSTDLRGKLRAFNKNARAISKAEISEDTVPLNRDPKIVQAGCTSARDALRNRFT